MRASMTLVHLERVVALGLLPVRVHRAEVHVFNSCVVFAGHAKLRTLQREGATLSLRVPGARLRAQIAVAIERFE